MADEDRAAELGLDGRVGHRARAGPSGRDHAMPIALEATPQQVPRPPTMTHAVHQQELAPHSADHLTRPRAAARAHVTMEAERDARRAGWSPAKAIALAPHHAGAARRAVTLVLR